MAEKEDRYNLTSAMATAQSMSADEVLAAEKDLMTGPDSLQMRIQLLSFYALNQSADSFSELKKHANWIATKYSDVDSAVMLLCQAGLDFENLERQWLDNAKSDNPRILQNASLVFRYAKPRIAIAALERLCGLEPTHWEHPATLASILKTSDAGKALDFIEQALTLTDDTQSKLHVLTVATEIAYGTANLEKAAFYAEQMVHCAPSISAISAYGVFLAHSVLGRVAIHDQDLNEAARQLLLSVELEEVSQMRFRVPDLELAQELLNRGRVSEVCDFLLAAQIIWPNLKEKFESLIKDIRKGNLPVLSSGIGAALFTGKVPEN